jgi:DNA-binding protein H-NS
MSSYKELVQQREALEKQISEARSRETASAIAQVRSLISDFDLTQEDIFPTGKVVKARGVKKPSGKVAPKYRNLETGETWTGRGKPPKWIQGKDRDAFVIV